MGKGKNHKPTGHDKFKIFGFTLRQNTKFVAYVKANKDLATDTSYSCSTNTVYILVKVADQTLHVRLSDHQQFTKKYDYEINPYNGNNIEIFIDVIDSIRKLTKIKTA